VGGAARAHEEENAAQRASFTRRFRIEREGKGYKIYTERRRERLLQPLAYKKQTTIQKNVPAEFLARFLQMPHLFPLRTAASLKTTRNMSHTDS
jgi:hypothetical protein